MAWEHYLPVRINDDGHGRLQAVADAEFEGNRSAALRRLLALGLAAWQAGHREPGTIREPR